MSRIHRLIPRNCLNWEFRYWDFAMGHSLMMHVLGGKVEKAPVREYGKTEVFVKQDSPLFAGVSATTICWMSHFDYISKTAPGFEICCTYGRLPGGSGRECRRRICMRSSSIRKYCIRRKERRCCHNFVCDVCGCAGDWKHGFLCRKCH